MNDRRRVWLGMSKGRLFLVLLAALSVGIGLGWLISLPLMK